jgi:hypothetical protein
MLPGVVLAIVAAVSAPQVPTDVIREQVERELALVRHLHRHVLAPCGAGQSASYPSSAPPTAAYATSSPTGCQTLRLSAGTSSSSAGMLRALECWTSMQAWPGWVAQVVESLDWSAPATCNLESVVWSPKSGVRSPKSGVR